MGEKRSFEREAMDGRTGERTRMCKLAYLRRLRSHQLRIEGLSVMLGAPRGSKGRPAAAAPWLLPAIWQKTLNKVSLNS